MRRRGIFILFFLVPLSFLALVFYYPLFLLVREGLAEGGHWSLRPLLTLLRDPYVLHLILFTLKQAFLSTLVALAIGLPGAYLLTRYDFPGKRVVRSLAAISFVLPSITVALGFVLFFGHSGHLNRSLMEVFHLSRPPLRLLYSLWGIVLAHAFYNAPLVMRLVHAAWEGLDPALGEAAASLGAGRAKRFVSVTLPLLLPSISSSAVLVFLFTFLSFPIVLILGGARYATIEVGIYTFVRTLLDLRLGAALLIVEIVLTLGLAYLYLKTEGRFAFLTRGEGRAPGRPLRAERSIAVKAFLFVYIGLACVFFLGPIVSVVVDSFRGPGGFTLANYRELLSLRYSPFLGSSPLHTVMTSLLVGAVSTGIALPLGIGVAILATRRRFPARRLLETLLLAPLAVSSVAVGFALLRGLAGPPLRLAGTVMSIAIAHALTSYPLVARAVRPVLEGLDPGLVEAARSLGAPRWRAFFSVELPLVRQGVVAAAIFAFALSAGEMSATILLMRPGLSTIPVAIYGLLSARQFGAASAMATVLIAVAAFSFLLIDRVGEGWRRG